LRGIDPNTFELPINVVTLSCVNRVVVNKQTSVTVPVTPAAKTGSPPLTAAPPKNAPNAKFDSNPDHPAPIANPAPAIKVANDAVSIPNTPIKTTASAIFSATDSVLRAYPTIV